MAFRRSAGQLRLLQRLLSQGGQLRPAVSAAEHAEGLQALSACLRAAGGNSVLPGATQAATEIATQLRWFSQRSLSGPSSGIARFSGSSGGWQYGSASQPWWRPGQHAFHMVSAPHAQQSEEDQAASERRKQKSTHKRHVRRGSTAIADGSRSAEQCDQVISSLKKTRSKYVRAQAPFGNVSWSKQLRIWAETGVNIMRKVLAFTVSIPGRIQRFIALTAPERREIYKGWWSVIKKEARHYWAGTKLLWADIKIASRLIYKAASGRTLTRRERKQLTRTAADIFRLVPMAVFLVVPFMELLLPVALKLFPNMLPSTFEDKLKKEEELKKRLNVKLEVAKFLQDTVADMAKEMRKNKTGAAQASAAELYDFMKKVRAGERVDNSELVKFAQLFNDELTLDNLERIHLVNLCRFVGITPFGTDEFLRARLRARLAAIKADDRAIKAEGLDNLEESELREACRARGIRSNVFGEGAAAFMRKQLEEWLELSLNRALPSSLLLLSRAFTVTQPTGRKAEDADLESLKDTLSALNKEVLEEVGLEVGDIGDMARQYEKKLEQLKREEELIREEQVQAVEALPHDDKAAATAQRATSAPQLAAQAAASAVLREAAASAVVDVLQGESAEEKASKVAAAREEKMRKVLSALAVLASSSGVSAERDTFLSLVQEEINRVNKQLAERASTNMTFQRGGITVERPGELHEVVGAKRLEANVQTILQRIERELDHVDSRIGERMHVLDMDNDGLISKDELQTAMGFLSDQLGEDELRHLLERLNAFRDDAEPINVNNLMALAAAESGSAKPVSS